MSDSREDGLYRPNVGILLFDPLGRVWVGRRAGVPHGWQMPQGGIDEGETPRQACLRELAEEVGTGRATIVAEIGEWLRYDLPPELARSNWRGRYRGQRQKWFALRFEGRDEDFDLQPPDGGEAEFDAWRWVELDRLTELIVAFKRPVYERVVEEFRALVADSASAPLKP